MDNNSYDQLLIMEATIDANRQYSDKQMKKLTAEITAMIKWMMGRIKILKYSP